MSIQEDIFDYVRSFPPWKQELYLRAALSPELDEQDICEVAAMLLDDPSAGVPRDVRRDDLPGGNDSHDEMIVHAIADVVNVNALADGQTLKFAPGGLNIVYGRNGAGKTGYSRILKFAGRTLHRETLLTNISGDRRPPTATVTVSIGGREQQVALELHGAPPALLGRICIADTHAGERYLSSATKVDYAPVTLESLSRLAGALKKLDGELQQRLADRRPDPLDLRPFGDGTAVAATLAGITSALPDDAVIALATLSEQEREQLAELRVRRGEIDARQTSKLRAAAERDADAVSSLLTAIGVLGRAVSAESLDAERKRLLALTDAHAAAKLVAESFVAEPVQGAGSDSWRALWESARSFVSHQGHELPPGEDPAFCPLCMQELSEDARERLVRFDRYVKDDVNTRLRGAEHALAAAREAVPDMQLFAATHAAAAALLEGAPGLLFERLRTWLALAEASFVRLRSGELAELTPITAAPSEDLQRWIAARRAEAEAHAALEDAKAQESLTRELAELESRETLAKRNAEVLAHLAALRETDRLKEAKAKTGTGSVSVKITALSRELIEADVQGALNRQLQALDFTALAVEAKSKTVRGTSLVALRLASLAGVPLTDVLSQGEQRRVGLAMFLAEMEVQADRSPIVLDDPACSIDQEGRRHIARALCALAAGRQVIVFTHELAFVHELHRRAPSELPVHVQHVRRVGATAGHIHDGLPWEGLKASQRPEALHLLLKELRELHDAQDLVPYRSAVIEFCMKLRASFERAVEEKVLADTVTRRSDTIRTTNLSKVNASPEVCALVDRGVDESSPWVHDSPPADGVDPPTPAELLEGLELYEQLLATLKTAAAERQQAKTDESTAPAPAPPRLPPPASMIRARRMKPVAERSRSDT